MKNFKFRIENSSYVRWNFLASDTQHYLYTTFNTEIQTVFDLTIEFKKNIERLMNGKHATRDTEIKMKEIQESFRVDIIKILDRTDFCAVFSESPFHMEFQIFSRAEILSAEKKFLKSINILHKDIEQSNHTSKHSKGSVNHLLYEFHDNKGKFIGLWESIYIDKFVQGVGNLDAIVCLQILTKTNSVYVPIDLTPNFDNWRKFLRQIFENRKFRRLVFPPSTMTSDDYILNLYSISAQLTQILRSSNLICDSIKVDDGHFMFPNMIVNPFLTRSIKTEMILVLKLGECEIKDEYEMFI